MKTIAAITKIVEESGMSKRAVSEAMGRSGNYLASVIEQSQRKGGGVRSSTLSSIAEACGYSLVLVPAEKVDDGMLVIDPPEDDTE